MKDTDFKEETALTDGLEDISAKSREVKEAEPNTRRREILFPWLTAVLMSAVISASSILLYDRYFAARIVAVDIKGFIADQRDLYVQGKISEEQLRQNIETLDRTIQSIPKNVVVIMGDAVVRNAKVIKP